MSQQWPRAGVESQCTVVLSCQLTYMLECFRCRSAPVVTPSQADPVKLQCTPPSGGPFKTCSVELCPAPQPKRRLHQTGCTVVTCTYGNSGADSCDIDLTGKVKQGTPYTINSTAIMADGSRKSLTGAQGSYTVPFFP